MLVSRCGVRMIEVVTSYLEQLMLLQSEPHRSQLRRTEVPMNAAFANQDHFTTDPLPNITLKDYVKRTLLHMKCTPECFVFALAYIRRAVDKGFPLTLHSVHRLYITALTIAAKIRDDLYCSMVHYGKVGCVRAEDLAMMEMCLLAEIIDFRANVSVEEYHAMCEDITRAVMTPVAITSASTGSENELSTVSSADSTTGSRSRVTAIRSLALTSAPPIASVTPIRSSKGRLLMTGSVARATPIETRLERPVAHEQCARVRCMRSWTAECNVFSPV